MAEKLLFIGDYRKDNNPGEHSEPDKFASLLFAEMIALARPACYRPSDGDCASSSNMQTDRS
jgi:hypothetical protein